MTLLTETLEQRDSWAVKENSVLMQAAEADLTGQNAERV